MALYSYMITNRAYPWETWSEYIYPTTAGTLFYFMAAGANNINPADYVQINGNAVPPPMPSSVQSSLEADIESTGPRGKRQVTVYIHGLANYLTDACEELGQFGLNLAAQGYNGLLIGFSWPSYGEYESWKSYSYPPYSFPPTAEYGTIRDNIQGSTRSLLNLLLMLKGLCSKTGAQLNVMCHSEGNYMLMLAMYAWSLHPDDPALPEFAGKVPLMDQVLLVAADINTGALTTKTPSQPWAAQGWWINNSSNAVTIYWSTNDDKLPYSDQWTNVHNPGFPNRLGLWGPDTTAAGLLSHAYAVNCSLVAIASNPNVGPNGVHQSYFYIPQILADMTQTLNNVPPGQVTNRVSTGIQQFRMNPSLTSALATAFVPRSARLPKKVLADKGGAEAH